MKRVCVFCGSSSGSQPVYLESAEILGNELVKNGFGLVYGGGNVGLMGKLASTVMANGGEAIGIITKSIALKVDGIELTETHVVETMHERKALMHQYSDAFIALPGGFGTLEELMEAITWCQLGYHGKPIGILNLNGFFDKLMEFFNYAVDQEFIGEIHRQNVVEEREPVKLLERLQTFTPRKADKWAFKN